MIFNHFVQMLDIDIGNSSNPIPNDRQWPVHALTTLPIGSGPTGQIAKFMAKLIVSTLSPSSPTQDLLEQLLHSVRTAYHPHNEDAWSLPLAVLLRFLAVYYAKRHGRKQRNNVPIDQNEVDRFVKAVLDTALLALYSSLELMAAAAEHTLKALAYVSPKVVFDALLGEVFPSLDAVTETHRTMSAVKALYATSVPLFNRRLHPQGAQHLQPLLFACLPAIDANDLPKSVAALSFYWSVFSIIPFHEPNIQFQSVDGGSVDVHAVATPVKASDSSSMITDGENEEDARRATMDLNEWALAFMQKLIDFVMHLDGGDSAERCRLNIILLRLLKRVSHSFFACLSAPIHAQCSSKLINVIARQLHLNARKPLGILVSAASSSHESSTFVNMAFDSLESRLQSSAHDCAVSELQFSLSMLSSLVKRAGANLVPLVERIEKIVLHCIRHDEKKVRQCTRKLVSNTLRALTQAYPLEYASYPASWWTKSSNPKHWQWWGRFHEVGCSRLSPVFDAGF